MRNHAKPTATEARLLLLCLLLLAAVTYLLAYRPNQAQRERLEREATQMRERVAQLRIRLQRLTVLRDELEATQPGATRTAIREVLRKAAPGTYLVVEPNETDK